MALVFEDAAVAGPATHAIIIGIGDYPHLPGGSSDVKARIDAKMRQLSSPPKSARTFADWLIGRFENPARPLASVELLLGEASLDFQPPQRAGAEQPPAVAGAATLANIADAAFRWKERGNLHPDSLLLFYFCGHGISKGEEFALVASDYGHSKQRPLDGLISVPEFLVAMQDCTSTDQCFFIDACRVTDERLVETGNYGHSLVQKVAAETPGMKQCVYYSTLGGETAHGRKNEASFYTQALLWALNGSGAEDGSGDWRVNTVGLFGAIAHLMRELAGRIPKVQNPQSGSQVMYDLHWIADAPELPFLLQLVDHDGDDPPPAVESLVFRQDGADLSRYPEPTPPLSRSCVWQQGQFETWLPEGHTEFEIGRSGEMPVLETHFLRPPGKWLKGK